jgi:beta-glucosidase-like glycosyl hydrolase
VTGDFERSASMRLNDTKMFPDAMVFGADGDPELSRYEGQVTGIESRALVVLCLFYPVADVKTRASPQATNR